MTRPVAVIAGAGPGLGSALASSFAANGYAVAAISRTGRAVPSADAFSADLCNPAEVNAVIETISQRLGSIEVYVHNVASLHLGPFLETSSDTFDAVWRDTLLTAVHGAQAVLPSMLSAGRGVLLFSGATASVRGGATSSAFAAAKSALRSLAQSLAREFHPRGIHVAHVLLDGLMLGTPSMERFGAAPESGIDPSAAAESFVALVRQGRSAWSHEIDLRPHCERF